MATPQDKPPYSPISERDEEGAAASPRGGGGGCGCFRRFCFDRNDGYLLQEIRLGGGGGHMHEETWLVAKLNKLKQLSEMVAGPKWKNFVRKIGRFCRHKKQAAPPLQYSPESYALNFAGGQDHEEEVHLYHSFSSRFAVNDHQKSAGGLM